MSAPLNPQQFFHGTTANLEIGDEVVPGAEIGKWNYPWMDEERNKKVYVAPDEAEAWHWAGGDRDAGTKGRQVVYRVQPHATPVRTGEYGDEHTTTRATVVDRIDIPPAASFDGWGKNVGRGLTFRRRGVPELFDDVPGAPADIRGSRAFAVQGQLPPEDWDRFDTWQPPSYLDNVREQEQMYALLADAYDEDDRRAANRRRQGTLF